MERERSRAVVWSRRVKRQCRERFHSPFSMRIAISAVTTPTTEYNAMTSQKLRASSCWVKNTEPREYGARTLPALRPARVCQAHSTGRSNNSTVPSHSNTAPTNLREALWTCIRLTSRMSDSAPLALTCQLKRHRRVHSIRLLGGAFCIASTCVTNFPLAAVYEARSFAKCAANRCLREAYSSATRQSARR